LLGGVLTGDARLLTVAHAPESAHRHTQAPRIGLCRTPQWGQADADVQAAWDHAVATLGPAAAALFDTIWPAMLPDLVALQLQVMQHEMARALRSERLRHGDQLSPRLRQLLDEGWALDGTVHARALAARRRAQIDAEALFAQADVLLLPITTGVAPAGLDATRPAIRCSAAAGRCSAGPACTCRSGVAPTAARGPAACRPAGR